ncbi:hypothetical protein OG337_20670 [[Kitasatospora] papulosa]|uniref:hypothetical protein n=1 Tax=Streptomyces TaxID=1883 RepID=UPI000AC885DF|nr:hypothetical protein [Streptomyces flavovirens]WSZ49609.1 hypothetical protein OG337_20670 [[Kitasatospora] papulosa]
MRILTLDAYLDSPDVTNGYFRSPATIFEYDVVFWDPANTVETYSRSSPYQGQPRIADDETTNILQDIVRRRKEFKEFLEMGRILAIFVAPAQKFWFDTGKRDKSGTGRNQKVTTLLDNMDIAEKAIPAPFKVAAGQGTRITARQPGYRSLISGSADRWWYRAILEEFPGESIAVVSGTDKCIGSIYQNDKGGILAMLPDFQSPDLLDYEEDAEAADGDETTDPEEGLERIIEAGTEVGAVENITDQASLDLIAWVESLRTKGREPQPAWLHRYQFAEDAETAARIGELEEEQTKISKEIEKLKERNEISDHWKRLLYATGDELEAQVMAAFRVLGFDAKRGPEGRADIMLQLDTRCAVVEVKGLNGSAAEKNAAQLEKWISEEMLSGAGKVKGILVINAHRLTPPDARSNPSFPNQMVKFSTPREHCLVTTVQLLAMVRTVIEKQADASSIAEELLNTTGTVSGWSDIVGLFTES